MGRRGERPCSSSPWPSGRAVLGMEPSSVLRSRALLQGSHLPTLRGCVPLLLRHPRGDLRRRGCMMLDDPPPRTPISHQLLGLWDPFPS